MEETLCRIRNIYRLLNNFEESFHAKYDLRLNEGMLLCTLAKSGQCTSGQLADKMGLTASNTSKVIASAEKKGFIKRTLGADDKRQMYFIITDAGNERLELIKRTATEAGDVITQIKEM